MREGLKYQTKQVIIEARIAEESVLVKTLEGDVMAEVGDYIITGVNGEKYPVKEATFNKIYNPHPSEPNRYIKKPRIVEVYDPLVTDNLEHLISNPALSLNPDTDLVIKC